MSVATCRDSFLLLGERVGLTQQVQRERRADDAEGGGADVLLYGHIDQRNRAASARIGVGAAIDFVGLLAAGAVGVVDGGHPHIEGHADIDIAVLTVGADRVEPTGAV